MKSFNFDEFEHYLLVHGFTVVRESNSTIFGTEILHAHLDQWTGNYNVIVGSNGNCRIDKPNGTSKWYYGKSTKQLCNIVKSIFQFYAYYD